MAGKNEVTLTFAGDHDQLKRAMGEVGDAADSMSREVAGASQRVGAETREMGASFDRAAEATDTLDTRSMGFRDTVTGVQDSVRGFADVLRGDLSADALVTAGAGVGDLASGMTNFLIPSMKNAIGGMKNARTAALAWATANRGLLVSTGGVAAVLGGLFLAVQQGVKDFQAVEVETDKLVEDLNRLAKSGRETGEVTRLLSREFGDVSTALDLAAQDAKSNWLDRNFIWSPGKRGEVNQAVEDIGALDEALVDIIEGGGDGQAALVAFAEAADLSADEVEQLKARLPGYTEAMKRAVDRTRDMAGEQDAAAEATIRHMDSLRDLTDVIKAQTDPLFGFVEAGNRVHDAQQAMIDAAKEFGRDSPQFRSAVLDVAQANFALDSAIAEAVDATDGDLIPALNRMVEDGQLSRTAFNLLVETIENVKVQAERLDGTRSRVFVDFVERTLFERAPVAGVRGGGRQAFHSGGTIPGAPGSEVLALVQAGEHISPVRASAGDGAALTVTVGQGGGSVEQAMAQVVLTLIRNGALSLRTSSSGQVVAA